MPHQCQDLPGTAAHTVALVFDLVGSELLGSPDRIASVLRSSKVQKAVEQALFDEAMKILKEEQKAGQRLDDAAISKRQASAVVNAAAKAGGEQLRQQIEASNDYKRVQRSLADLQCAWKKTPVGAWVDENQGLLILIASGVVVGGAVAMYSARAGDLPATGLTYLANQKLKGIKLGSVELGAQGLAFTPSKREVAGGLVLKTDIRRVKSEFSIQVSTAEGAVRSIGGSAQTKVPLGKALSGTGKASLSTDGYQLLLSIDHKPKQGLSVGVSAWVLQKGDENRLGGGASASYTKKVDDLKLSAFAKGKVEAVRGAGSSGYGPAYEVNVGIGVDF